MSDDQYVVRREEIEAMEGFAKTHFLNDNARRINRSLGDLTGLTGLGFHLIEVQPGRQSTELHVHHHEDECVYVLEGEADARIGDEVIRVRAGDFIGYRAGGLPHTMTNPGPDVLRCIVVGQRRAHDTVDYPEAGKRLYRNEGLPWNLVDREAVDEIDGGRKR